MAVLGLFAMALMPARDLGTEGLWSLRLRGGGGAAAAAPVVRAGLRTGGRRRGAVGL